LQYGLGCLNVRRAPGEEVRWGRLDSPRSLCLLSSHNRSVTRPARLASSRCRCWKAGRRTAGRCRGSPWRTRRTTTCAAAAGCPRRASNTASTGVRRFGPGCSNCAHDAQTLLAHALHFYFGGHTSDLPARTRLLPLRVRIRRLSWHCRRSIELTALSPRNCTLVLQLLGRGPADATLARCAAGAARGRPRRPHATNLAAALQPGPRV